jgi:hypothetical protein
MPFSIKLFLGADQPIAFEGWLDDAFDKYVPKGTAFARASDSDGPGSIVTNGPMVLSSKASITPKSTVKPGEVVAFGSADGEDIPYGKPSCLFIRDSQAR